MDNERSNLPRDRPAPALALTAPPPPCPCYSLKSTSWIKPFPFPFRLPFSSSLCLLYGSLLPSNTYPKLTVHSLMPIFMFAINTLYQFVLFTLSCILCIPFIICFNCHFAERRKQINSISIKKEYGISRDAGFLREMGGFCVR